MTRPTFERSQEAWRAFPDVFEPMAKERDQAIEVLKRLCTPPKGSALSLGAHDRGPHHGAAVDAWNAAHELLRRYTESEAK